jgi:hypothetical protein
MTSKDKSPAEKAEDALNNEADLKAASKDAEPEPSVEIEFSYVTKEREPMFKVLYPGGGWRPALMNDGRLMWKIIASEKNRFEAHHHFKVGRIIRHHD